MKSFLAANPEVYFVPPVRKGDAAGWEYRPGAYYDTTTAAKHPYYRGMPDMPQPTHDLGQLRRDFQKWGFCKIADAIHPEAVEALERERC